MLAARAPARHRLEDAFDPTYRPIPGGVELGTRGGGTHRAPDPPGRRRTSIGSVVILQTTPPVAGVEGLRARMTLRRSRSDFPDPGHLAAPEQNLGLSDDALTIAPRHSPPGTEP
jgi:hypothetical protein